MADDSSPTLSALLGQLFQPSQEGATRVGDVMDAVAERGFGIVLFLIGLPALVPVLPPGASIVVGGLVVVVAFQMTVGLSRPWLPNRVRDYAFSPKAMALMRERAVKMLQRLEKLSRPRWGIFTSRLASRLLGPLMIAIGLVLILPLPFLNTLPALGIMAIGLGLVNRDGLFVLLGAAICLGVVAFVALSPGLVVRVLHLRPNGSKA